MQRESSAWDNSALTVSTRDALYVMNAVELARRNAEPLKIGDKVRFANQALGMGGTGERGAAGRRPAIRDRTTCSFAGRSFDVQRNRLGPGLHGALRSARHVGPRQRGRRARPAAARVQHDGDRGDQGPRGPASRSAATPCRAPPRATRKRLRGADSGGAARCEFAQSSCRRSLDVLLERLRDSRIVTIRKSESWPRCATRCSGRPSRASTKTRRT